jgi:hypothetical protein
MNYLKMLFILFSICFIYPAESFAVVRTQTEANQITTGLETKSNQKFKKKKLGFWGKIKRALNLGDSEGRWLIFALILLGGAVVFGILGLGVFATLLGFGAFTCFVIWFLKLSNVI